MPIVQDCSDRLFDRARPVAYARPTVICHLGMSPDMTDRLQAARDDLEAAAKSADDDVRDEIRETTDAVTDYVVSDTEPDHTLLDERLNTLRQVKQRADGDTERRVDDAIDSIEDYRQTIDQA